jgi:hypothetical protein
MKRFGMKCGSIQKHIIHGRLKELMAGPLSRGVERWWASNVSSGYGCIVCICSSRHTNAIVKASTEEESNVVNEERKKRDQPRKEEGAIHT